MEVGAGIRDYIAKALSPQESIKFEARIEDLLKNVEIARLKKGSLCSKSKKEI